MEDEVAQTQVMEKVVDGICDCFIGEETDKKVQLQIIKVMHRLCVCVCLVMLHDRC